MTGRDFCFWLQGFFELARTQSLSETQVSMIERHLALVFQHEIDPSMGDAKHQTGLDAIHDLKPLFYQTTNDQDGPVRYRC